MKKPYESPWLEMIQLSASDTITSAEEGLSGPLDFGEGVEDF